jgi:hypothetical protein
MTLTQINKAGLDELALDHVFTIGASGTDHYTFQGEGLNGTVNDPTLYLTRGKTYRFENGTGAHPIRIQSTSGASGTAYNTGVTNNAGSGTVIVEVQHDAPDVLYYQCTSHANMNGILYITGALADGGVTTAKLADDAVTDAKLANSINSAIAANTAKTTNATHTGDVTGSGSLTIASGAVTTAKIAADAITDAKIADNAVRTEHIQTNNVTTAKINDLAVTEAKIANGAVTQTKIGDGSIINAKVDNSAAIAGTKISPDFGSQNIETDGEVRTGTYIKTRVAGGGHFYLRNNSTGANYSSHFQTTSGGFDNNVQTFVHYYHGGYAELLHQGNSSIRTLSNGAQFRNGGNVIGQISPDGLAFGTDTAAANGLDDYEEGTFTPQFNSGSSASACYASGESYSSQVGVYRKIGHVVHFIIKIQVSSGTLKSGILQINNLPFTSGDFSTYSTAGGASYGYTTGYFSDTANLPTIFVSPGGSVMQFFNTAGNNFAGTHLAQAAGRFDIHGHYFTS